MGFKFHPLKHVGASDVTRIAKDLHSVVNTDILQHYAQIILSEKEEDRCIAIDLMFGDETPYLIHVMDSGRNGQTRFSFIVYEGVDRKNAIGLLDVEGLKCVNMEEMI